MSKKECGMTKQSIFDIHSIQLNPNHIEYQKVRSESKKSVDNAFKSNNSSNKDNSKK